MASQSRFSFLLKLAALWIALLVLPLIERTLLGARTYYGLYIGLGLVFVSYGLTVRAIFAFLRHTRRSPIYVWMGFLLWSFLSAAFWQALLSDMISCPAHPSSLLRQTDL